MTTPTHKRLAEIRSRKHFCGYCGGHGQYEVGTGRPSEWGGELTEVITCVLCSGSGQCTDFTALLKVVEVYERALEFYAARENWEVIVGHTKWASNLNKQDCALLNCGGGRARLARTEAAKILGEG